MKARHGDALRHLDTLLNVGAVGGLTDAQLLNLFTTRRDEGAELAFEALVDRHGPMVLRVCRAVLRDPHDADDAFQVTFLVLARRAASLRVRDSLGPWLHQVARRTASYVRSAVARRRHERAAASPPGRLDGRSVHDDLGEVLHEEVGRLPERYRTAVVLCLLEGLTTEQAALHLGWPVGTVHSRLARGRERLRSRLLSRGEGPSVGLALLDRLAPASVPRSLAEPAIQAALRLAEGRAVIGTTATALASMEGVLGAMLLNKVMQIAALVLTVVVLATGAALLGRRAAGDQPTARAEETPRSKGQGEPQMVIDGPALHFIGPGTLLLKGQGEPQVAVDPKSESAPGSPGPNLKARIEIAQKMRDQMSKLYQGGEIGIEQYFTWQERYDSAVGELAVKNEATRMRFLEQKAKGLKAIEMAAREAHRVGVRSELDVLTAEFFSLEAEDALARAKGKKRPVTDDEKGVK